MSLTRQQATRDALARRRCGMWLYRAVAFGRSVREAFDLGTNAVGPEDIEGADIPDLLMREGVDPGRNTRVPPARRHVPALAVLGLLLVGAGVRLQ